MSYASRRVAAQIGRLGRKAEVLSKSKTGEDDFGNDQYSYTSDRYVLAFKTYPNRNTEVESNMGNLQRDNPVFLVPIGGDQPQPPQEEEYLKYDGQKYEVDSHTEYETHVEFFGDRVIDD